MWAWQRKNYNSEIIGKKSLILWANNEYSKHEGKN